ncbi:response regulator transcription factor [Bacteroidales bacterium AH-315-N07]|nr:response regulator transcription factor [Bacteroidales bacterium AH-315-N07]
MAISKTRILLAEDDPNLGVVFSEYLRVKGFEVQLCEDGNIAYTAFRNHDFDVCILDIMMPNKDGFTLAKDIRSCNKNIPIIFLTAKSMNQDKIKGFNIGCDDYITKPFHMEELLLRLKAILRRSQNGNLSTSGSNNFMIGKYKFDAHQQSLAINDKDQKLTAKESELLKLLCLNMNDILNREAALNMIWGENDYFNGRSMDVFITKLRKYLGDDPEIEIMNVHGKGYKLIVK